jgi:hypothetical protein
MLLCARQLNLFSIELLIFWMSKMSNVPFVLQPVFKANISPLSRSSVKPKRAGHCMMNESWFDDSAVITGDVALAWTKWKHMSSLRAAFFREAWRAGISYAGPFHLISRAISQQLRVVKLVCGQDQCNSDEQVLWICHKIASTY